MRIDEVILVKCSSDVRVSTRRAVRSKDLGTLKQTLEEEFRILDEKEKKTRSILAKLGATDCSFLHPALLVCFSFIFKIK